MTTWRSALEKYLECRTKGLVVETDDFFDCVSAEQAKRVKRYSTFRWEQLNQRNARPIKSKVQIHTLQVEREMEDGVVVRIEAREWYAYQLERRWHEQEKEMQMRVILHRPQDKWLVVHEEKIPHEAAIPVFHQYENTEAEDKRQTKTDQNYSYNRLQAIRYAEAWWNDYNPQFRHFDVDCTNFISQCLYAGGIPLQVTGSRSNGWWYRGGNSPSALWSFSWAVAHSFRWYLEKGRIRTETKSSADQLSLGDVICYDFDGDGRWQHSTIVVAKDGRGMPLVNAHTTNSRHRYWDYRDSTAYTPNIQYRFFHIL
jgi:hypothetical protein